MSDQPSTTTVLVTAEAPLFDDARLAVAGFLARFSGPTRISYTTDLKGDFAWCAGLDLGVFSVKRVHLELWARSMEEAGVGTGHHRAAAIHRGGVYRFAVIAA